MGNIDYTSTVIDICNQALRDIGEMPIVSLDEASKAARACAGLWDSARDFTQSLHEWPECLARMQLVEAVPPPPFGWTKRFQLPVDCLRILSLHEHDNYFDDWEIEGNTLLTNHQSASIVYIKRNSDAATWSILLKRCVRYRLASDLVIPINAKLEYKQTYEQLFWSTLAIAKGRTPRNRGFVNVSDRWVNRRW